MFGFSNCRENAACRKIRWLRGTSKPTAKTTRGWFSIDAIKIWQADKIPA
jgi:hypothetical protein